MSEFVGKWFLKHLLAAFLIVLVLVAAVAIFLNVVTRHGEELLVPDLSNMTVE